MNYTQLTQEQRYQIAVLKKAGHMQVEIARLIGVDKSTISRELSRNKGQRGYRPKQAHRLALEERRQQKVKSSISADEWLRIEALLRQEWSPEEVEHTSVWKEDVLSAMNVSTSMCMRTKEMAVICTPSCGAKSSARSVMVPTTDGVKSPTELALNIARLLLIRNLASETGKATPLSARATKGLLFRWWNVNLSTPCWVRSNARRPIW